jgi:hypothetical protein
LFVPLNWLKRGVAVPYQRESSKDVVEKSFVLCTRGWWMLQLHIVIIGTDPQKQIGHGAFLVSKHTCFIFIV